MSVDVTCSHVVASYFAGPLLTFASGVAVGAVVGALTYATQFFYGEETPEKQNLGLRLHWLTVALWFVSTGVFVGGCVETYFAVPSMPAYEGPAMTNERLPKTPGAPFQRNDRPLARPPAEPPAAMVPHSPHTEGARTEKIRTVMTDKPKPSGQRNTLPGQRTAAGAASTRTTCGSNARSPKTPDPKPATSNDEKAKAAAGRTGAS